MIPDCFTIIYLLTQNPDLWNEDIGDEEVER